MFVLYPLKVVLTNWTALPPEASHIEVPDYPFDAARGSHTVSLGSEIYIDRSDFRLVDDPDYFGLGKGSFTS